MPDDVIISDAIVIPHGELELHAIRARGAGGQKVNKVSSAIHLRFDIRNSPSLPDTLRDRLLTLGDRRISSDGILVIKAQERRTQEQNRRAAIERFRELLQSALVEQKPRKKTRPTRQSQEQRLEDKKRRAALKRSRKSVDDDY